MFYNHKRLTVRKHDEGPSLCPDCGAELVARRGEIVIWHWAHKAQGHQRVACGWEESDWHLRWKHAYLHYAGWEIEYPFVVAGKKFILDAFEPEGQKVREFVHSLSPQYLAKHEMLATVADSVLWLWDGVEFMSKRCKSVANGGVKRLLKPVAKKVHAEIGGYVHVPFGPFKGVWKHWKADVWYRIPNSDKFLLAYEMAGAEA